MIPVLMVIAIFLGVSLLVHFPVVPLLFLLIWVGAGRRRGGGGGRGPRRWPGGAPPAPRGGGWRGGPGPRMYR